jgi:hypothetical protein
VGVAIGQRLWMVDVWGLVKTIWVSAHLVGSLTCWRKGLRMVPLFCLLACIVMLSAINCYCCLGHSPPKWQTSCSFVYVAGG